MPTTLTSRRRPVAGATLALASALLALGAPRARALAIVPSFELDANAWTATEVVVATEGARIDGKLVVTESWVGALRPGDAIDLPALGAFASPGARAIGRDWIFGDDGHTPHADAVSGDRMILFLVREKDGALAPAAGEWGGMKTSTAWVEGEQGYGFVQVMNPGDAVLIPVGAERAIRARVQTLAKMRTDLGVATRIEDAARRADALLRFIDEPIAADEAYRGLAGCGAEAVPLLARLFADEARIAQCHAIVGALVAADREAAADILMRRLDDESLFWSRVGPGLEPGWWNGAEGRLEWDRVNALRARYGVTHAVLNAVAPLRDERCRAPVRDARAVWRSIDALEGVGGGQIGDACDAVLRALDGGE